MPYVCDTRATNNSLLKMHLNVTVGRAKSKLLPIHVYFKENFKEFLIETSLHGLKCIQDAHRNIYERSYYLISFSIVFTSGIYMALYFLSKWQNTPVIISKSSIATSIHEIPFPAVTFCNMNQVIASKVKDFQPDTPEYGMLKKICFDDDYNFTRFRNLKPRFKDDTFDNFIVKNSQKCSDMIIYCKYGPNEEVCSDLFREILLDEGMCCVFNQLHPFFLYKGDYKFIFDYTSSNGRTSIPVNWTLEDGYEKELPKSYYPRPAAGAGVSMGLTVILNAELDEYYCSSTNGPGFKMLLYNPVDAPHIKETGLPVKIGHQTRVRINTKRTEAMHSLRSISPTHRQCYFSGENNLLYFKYYTRRNCEMECDSKLMLRRCNCVQYHMPLIYKNTSICFLDKMDCVVETEGLILDPETLKCKEECISGCHNLVFYPDMFASPLATGNFKLQHHYFHNVTKRMIHKNLAMVQIYFKEHLLRANTKVPYTGFTEFLSQTGGIMSLMVGFSVISLTEVVFFVTLKPFVDMLLKRNPNAKNTENIKQVSEYDKFHHQMIFKRRRSIKRRIMQWNTKDLEKYRNTKNAKY